MCVDAPTEPGLGGWQTRRAQTDDERWMAAEKKQALSSASAALKSWESWFDRRTRECPSVACKKPRGTPGNPLVAPLTVISPKPRRSSSLVFSRRCQLHFDSSSRRSSITRDARLSPRRSPRCLMINSIVPFRRSNSERVIAGKSRRQSPPRYRRIFISRRSRCRYLAFHHESRYSLCVHIIYIFQIYILLYIS